MVAGKWKFLVEKQWKMLEPENECASYVICIWLMKIEADSCGPRACWLSDINKDEEVYLYKFVEALEFRNVDINTS